MPTGTLKVVVVWWTLAVGAAVTLSQDADPYQRLVDLHGEILAMDLQNLDELHEEIFQQRAEQLPKLKLELSDLDPSEWEITRRVDYLLVHAQLSQLLFEHAALRPWRRDPGFYVDRVSQIPFAELPLDPPQLEALETQLSRVPEILEHARKNLTEGAGELVQLALRNLEYPDGVGHGHPIRDEPPAGVIGWYRDLWTRMRAHHPESAPAVASALASLEAFRDWLREASPQMNAPAGVGLDHYNWYLLNARLMPFRAREIVSLGERELHRALGFLALESWRNRHLPPLSPAPGPEEYERRIQQADQKVRDFLTQQKILTLPDDLGPFGHNVPFTRRPEGHLNFWEAVQFRDPLPDHVHAVLPGHRFDALLHQRDERPIRRHTADSGRIEGWGFYLEEMMLQSGLLDDRPRTRELFYIFQAARAVRNRAEIGMHLNQWSVKQAADYMVETVPFMDEDVARVDCEIYLRRPGYGISYMMGKIQIEQLLADRKRQLGDDFNLTAFHDQFLAAGWIPISLIRWEMTGLEDQVGNFWKLAGK